MALPPLRAPHPASGYHRIDCERRFFYLEQDPTTLLRVKWLKVAVTCPVCAAGTGLTLVLEQGADDTVQVRCPARHHWPEPAIDVAHFITYSRLLHFGALQPDLMWIADAGFGEDPPPPIDNLEQIRQIATWTAKRAVRKGRTKVKRAVRTPLRKARRRALRAAFTPVAAALRAAWVLRTGALPAAPARPPRPPAAPKTPPLSAYRKAYRMPAPKKRFACLVCEDTGWITAPGVSIKCTECEGPVAAALKAAERKAGRARTARAGGERARE
ncbi:hypothetical protein ABT390_34010 [Streptomyces aurantiacus]|uniref:Uncharacterized protein n=1 Tax=Streptomyces aurantiacus JA 4570 TaxID=1286094 RepID=S3ZTU2_9ACTN|nr:hypothetical protein [Streptomyces aurantiacus]EPH46866.1 hypothetical protein STRAU_0032 [Streptomyces aurantiacus JA 4570]